MIGWLCDRFMRLVLQDHLAERLADAEAEREVWEPGELWRT